MDAEKMEALSSRRKSISAENRKLRSDLSRGRQKIKELERRIEIEKWDMKRINELINKNTEEFIQAGKQLQ